MKFKLNPKQIMLIVMCVLLVTVIIMTCVVIGKIGSLFQSTDNPGESTAPSGTTEPSTDPSADPTDPSTQPSTDPTVAPHDHNFVKTETVKPTCSTIGYTLYTCSQCGQAEMRDFMDPKGHEFGEPEIVELTCEQDGYTLLTCLRCGGIEKRDEEKAPGHDYQFTQTVEVSCTVDGGDQYKCSNCGDVKMENLVEATGHNHSDWRPVDGNPGKEQRICVICLETEYRDVAVEKDWEDSKFTINDVDSKYWTHHIVMITLKSGNTSLKYDIYIGLENRDITYTYGTDGLTVSYTTMGETKTYTLPANMPGVMTVYSDGTVSDSAPDNVPEPSDPSDPTDSTDPTQSTDPTDATENIENPEN